MENHKWVHDKTAKGAHVPRDCNGSFEAAVDAQKKMILDSCKKCGRKEAAHDGTEFDDHSKCVLTCSNCGDQWQCTKLYPQDKPCKGAKGVVSLGRPEDNPDLTEDKADTIEGQHQLGEQGEFDPNDCRGCEQAPATVTCMECKNRFCADCIIRAISKDEGTLLEVCNPCAIKYYS